MSERVSKWQPVSDIDSPFESISYSFQSDALLVRMIGTKTLVLRFSKVVALRFEQECPGIEFFTLPLPMLAPAHTFPLLIAERSPWLENFKLVYSDIAHFGLVSSDHLLEVLADPNVAVEWESYNTAEQGAAANP